VPPLGEHQLGEHQFREHHLTVPRTARYYTLGEPGPATREIWIVCHGYGQLARDFVANFTPVSAPGRTIVGPEALSRYYLDDTRGGSHATSQVGATWMTREDRDSEIADQISYLDSLHAAVAAQAAPGAALTVLGFSQGVATVCRWLDRGRTRADRLICWGGAIPDDVRLGQDSPIRHPALWLVAGLRDIYATAERVAHHESVLRAAGVPFTRLTFDGGHRLDDGTMRRLADSG
jgi:predicted esterase